MLATVTDVSMTLVEVIVKVKCFDNDFHSGYQNVPVTQNDNGILKTPLIWTIALRVPPLKCGGQ